MTGIVYNVMPLYGLLNVLFLTVVCFFSCNGFYSAGVAIIMHIINVLIDSYEVFLLQSAISSYYK